MVVCFFLFNGPCFWLTRRLMNFSSFFLLHVMTWNTWILRFKVDAREEKRRRSHNCESNKWPFLWGWDCIFCFFLLVCDICSHCKTASNVYINFEWSDETGLMTGITSRNNFYRNLCLISHLWKSFASIFAEETVDFLSAFIKRNHILKGLNVAFGRSKSKWGVIIEKKRIKNKMVEDRKNDEVKRWSSADLIKNKLWWSNQKGALSSSPPLNSWAKHSTSFLIFFISATIYIRDVLLILGWVWRIKRLKQLEQQT